MNKFSKARTSCFLALVFASACTGEDLAGTGSLQIRASGAEAMREGFPHQEADFDQVHEFVDGWSLQFERFVLTVGSVELREQTASAGEQGTLVGEWQGPTTIDLMNPPEGAAFATISDVPAVRHDVGFTVVAPDASAENFSATDEDFARMQAEGFVFFMAGVATSSSGAEVPFEVGVQAPTRFSRCDNGVDQTSGIAVEANKTTSVTIYPHSTHFWWDALLAGDADLRFDPWAEAAGSDRLIDAADLATQDLLSLRTAEGEPLVDESGNPVRYDDGGALPPGELNLLRYFEYGFRQSLHFNGLGFCPWEPL